MASGATSDIWHFDGRKYRLVDCVPVAYPRSERRKIDGCVVLVSLPPVEFTVCTAVLVGNEILKKEIEP